MATPLWTTETMAESTDLLRQVLGPAGNPARERIFRMQITLCIHRACTPEEIEQLPAYFHADEATDLAGGPVEILFETEEGSPSTRPCRTPERIPLDPQNGLPWFPRDCRRCGPRRARASLDAQDDKETGRAPAMLSDMFRGAGA